MDHDHVISQMKAREAYQKTQIILKKQEVKRLQEAIKKEDDRKAELTEKTEKLIEKKKKYQEKINQTNIDRKRQIISNDILRKNLFTAQEEEKRIIKEVQGTSKRCEGIVQIYKNHNTQFRNSFNGVPEVVELIRIQTEHEIMKEKIDSSNIRCEEMNKQIKEITLKQAEERKGQILDLVKHATFEKTLEELPDKIKKLQEKVLSHDTASELDNEVPLEHSSTNTGSNQQQKVDITNRNLFSFKSKERQHSNTINKDNQIDIRSKNKKTIEYNDKNNIQTKTATKNEQYNRNPKNNNNNNYINKNVTLNNRNTITNFINNTNNNNKMSPSKLNKINNKQSNEINKNNNKQPNEINKNNNKININNKQPNEINKNNNNNNINLKNNDKGNSFYMKQPNNNMRKIQNKEMNKQIKEDITNNNNNTSDKINKTNIVNNSNNKIQNKIIDVKQNMKVVPQNNQKNNHGQKQNQLLQKRNNIDQSKQSKIQKQQQQQQENMVKEKYEHPSTSTKRKLIVDQITKDVDSVETELNEDNDEHGQYLDEKEEDDDVETESQYEMEIESQTTEIIDGLDVEDETKSKYFAPDENNNNNDSNDNSIDFKEGELKRTHSIDFSVMSVDTNASEMYDDVLYTDDEQSNVNGTEQDDGDYFNNPPGFGMFNLF